MRAHIEISGNQSRSQLPRSTQSFHAIKSQCVICAFANQNQNRSEVVRVRAQEIEMERDQEKVPVQREKKLSLQNVWWPPSDEMAIQFLTLLN